MWYTQQLILHGAIVLLIGLFCGAPLGSAIVRAKAEERVRGWRVAHSSLVMGGVLLLAVAGITDHLRLGALAQHLLFWSLVVSSYSFAVVLPLAAHYGQRGLTPAGPFLNRAIYVGNMAGATGLIVGTVVLLWGAYGAL
jgi:hypothetical protein